MQYANTIGYSFDVFLRCACGHKACVQTKQYPGAFYRVTFTCTACGSTEPEAFVWPIWQRAMRREDFDPYR